MPYNSAFSASTFAREGKKRSTYLTEFEKDLVSICNEQANAGGKRFKWHFFFIQDFDVANPESETDIDYLILDKFNSAWKKKLGLLLKDAPAKSGVCKGKCWVSSLEGKSGDDKYYISIAGGISQVVLDDRTNPSTSSANKAVIVKALKKEWLKRLKIKAGEAESTSDGLDDEDLGNVGESNEQEVNTDIKQKIQDFKAINKDDEIEQIKKLVEVQKAVNALPENHAFRIKVQPSISKNFEEIEEEVEHEAQQDYTHFQESEMANAFVDDYDLAKEGIKELREFYDKWKTVVSLMEKGGVTVKTKTNLKKLDKLIKEEEQQYAKEPSTSQETDSETEKELKTSADIILIDLKTYQKEDKDKLKKNELETELEKLKTDFKVWYKEVVDANLTKRFNKFHKFVEERIKQENKYMEALKAFQGKKDKIASTAELRRELAKSGISHYNAIWTDYDNELKILEDFEKSFADFESKNSSDEIVTNVETLKNEVSADLENPGAKYYTDISAKATKDSESIVKIISEIPKVITKINNLPNSKPSDVTTKIEKIRQLQTDLPKVKESLDNIHEKALLGQSAVDIFAKGKKTKENSPEEEKLWEEFSDAIRDFEKMAV